jgi:serine phosphatase RsbU (regulator of sigma subunit)
VIVNDDATLFVATMANTPDGFSGAVAPAVHVVSNADLGYLALGTVFLALGLITLLLTILRAASRDLSIFCFGAMSCLWGLRFLLYTRLVPELLTGDPLALQRLGRGFTYVGGAAVFAFAWAYLGRGWRGTLRHLAYLTGAFAVGASVTLAIHPDRSLLLPAFNILILVGAAVVIANILHPQLRHRPRLRGLVAGICLSAVFFVLENLRALGVIPVPWDVEWIGVMILYVTLGRLIAIRLFTNERRLAAIRQELMTARRIQASLLPERPPRINGLAITTRYTPMTEVAGDVYDFVHRGDDRLGILVADVSGHGVPAALIASMVKGAFRAQTDHLDHPGRTLDGMNRILTGQLGREFVTASCTYIDGRAGTVRYAGAGHPPLLVQSPDADQCRSIERNGLILGQFNEATYSSVEWSLGARDRLLLYTDGLLEATNRGGEEFGETSLRQFVARNHRLSTEAFADALLASVAGWTGIKPGESFADDLTLVVVDRKPLET